MDRKKQSPKHRARQSRTTRRAERTTARERAAWFMAGKSYPTYRGRHAGEVA